MKKRRRYQKLTKRIVDDEGETKDEAFLTGVDEEQPKVHHLNLDNFTHLSQRKEKEESKEFHENDNNPKEGFSQY